jgi:hypothetical protein
VETINIRGSPRSYWFGLVIGLVARQIPLRISLMNEISQAIGVFRKGRPRRKACAALRLGASLWFVWCIAFTPLHLYLEPHADETEFASFTNAPTTIGGDTGHDDPGNHEQHSAAQHKLKVLRTHRAAPLDVVLAPVAECWVAAPHILPPLVSESSGLSPPEFACGWQFVFRAALPVRAPSLLS